MFLRIDLSCLSVEEARDVLQELVDRLQQLNREAVIPSTRTWRRAKKQIEAGAQTYETERA
jgi:hypothetical protein